MDGPVAPGIASELNKARLAPPECRSTTSGQRRLSPNPSRHLCRSPGNHTIIWMRLVVMFRLPTRPLHAIILRHDKWNDVWKNPGLFSMSHKIEVFHIMIFGTIGPGSIVEGVGSMIRKSRRPA